MLRSELLLLEDELCEAKTGMEKINVIEKFLIARMKATEPDKLILAALALIHKSKGNIRITDLMKELHVSQSPLEKRFRQAVGASPKKFATIVRLKNVVQKYTPSTSLTDLGYESGFYDQAHFIKEFKNFTGVAPGKFFDKEE
jgi:methylphosphotriester-DNA--protein-cysteine methyltransferase